MKMSQINIKYMSDEAVATLRNNIQTVTKYLSKNPTSNGWLNDFLPENYYITKKHEIEDFVLEIPTDSKDKKTDISNSIMLYEHLKDLPQYVLADERFWLWMNFSKGYEVAVKYMPVKDGDSVFRDHWLFTQGKRRGLFFGVLSRCYYRVALTVDDSLDDPYEYSRFIIEKPERFRNLSWRTFSSDKKIVLGCIKAEKRVLAELGMEEKSEYFTEIAKAVSQLGSVMLLDAMTEKDIEEYVYMKYKSIVERDMQKRTVVMKIIDTVNRTIKKKV